MKQILSLCLLTALLAGCGASTHVSSSGDTVNIGYGTQEKDQLTSAVSNVKVKKTDAQTYSDMYDYLRGRVAGVQVTSDKRIIIRGVNTINAGGDPLILVDGVETPDISDLNFHDIKSIDVLKDGSAAIYGLRGANGVLLITTKR